MGSYKKIRWDNADIRCPLFIENTEKETAIACEGFKDKMSVRLNFKAVKDKEHHMGIYCVHRFEECPIYRCVLKEKYGMEVKARN